MSIEQLGRSAFLTTIDSPGFRGQRLNLDEALGRVAVEGIPLVVRCQALIVERVCGLAADHRTRAFEELQANGAVQAALRRSHECIDCLFQRRKPLAVINAIRPGLLQRKLMMQDLTLKNQILQRLMRLDQRQSRRGFIALAAFDSHQTVLDHVDTTVTVLARDFIELINDAQIALLVAVDRIGHSTGKGELNIFRLIGRLHRIGGHGVDIRRRLDPGIFQYAALDCAAPQVIID